MAIPIKDSLLVPFSTNANARLVASGVTLYKVTAGQVTQYTTLHTAYLAAYNAMIVAREAGDRSESLTAVKDSTKKDLLDFARQIYAFVAANGSISDADKILLGVHVRLAPSPIPRPAVAPGVDLVSVASRTVSLRVHDGASATKRGKPAGARAAYIYSFVGPEYPADPAGWTFEGAATRPRVDVVFPAALPGGTQVWVRAAWVNAKQQPGPLSTPLTTTLQGGGAVTGGALKIAA